MKLLAFVPTLLVAAFVGYPGAIIAALAVTAIAVLNEAT
jgi:hypothetical protein